MRIGVRVSTSPESIRRIPRTVLQWGPLKSGPCWREGALSGETVIGSRCWPEKAMEEVSENSQAWLFTFWALPPSANRRTSADHLKGVRSFPIGREANRGRREQMSWERRANSQTKRSKREVKTFKPTTGHAADSVLSQLRLHTHTCANMCLESHTAASRNGLGRINLDRRWKRGFNDNISTFFSQIPNITLLMWVLQVQPLASLLQYQHNTCIQCTSSRALTWFELLAQKCQVLNAVEIVRWPSVYLFSPCRLSPNKHTHFSLYLSTGL